MRMCSTSEAYLQYKQACAVRIRQMITTSQDVQYERGISSVRMRMCSTSEAHLPGFSLGLDDMEGDLSPPIWGGDKYGGTKQ